MLIPYESNQPIEGERNPVPQTGAEIPLLPGWQPQIHLGDYFSLRVVTAADIVRHLPTGFMREVAPYYLLGPSDEDLASGGARGLVALQPNEPVALGRETTAGQRFTIHEPRDIGSFVSRHHATINLLGDPYSENYRLAIMNHGPNGTQYSYERSGVLKLTMAGHSIRSISKNTLDRLNEDTMLLRDDLQLAGIFDGVGKSKNPAQASKYAATTVEEFFSLEAGAYEGVTPTDAQDQVAHALRATHRSVQIRTPGGKTTGAIAKVYTDPDGQTFAAYGWTGDSRIYLLRGGKLQALSLDHSGYTFHDADKQRNMQDFLDTVMIEQELDAYKGAQTAWSVRSNVSTSLGTDKPEGPRIDTGFVSLFEGDRLIITSDGIHDNLAARGIQYMLTQNHLSTDQMTATALARAARDGSALKGFRSKPDDCSAVVISYFNR